MAKLTLREQRILRFPPTPKTWICTRSRVHDGVKTVCGSVQAGTTPKCVFCGQPKPSRPKLLWPEYERACQKAGIEPGTRWPPKVAVTEPAAPKKTRRKGSR